MQNNKTTQITVGLKACKYMNAQGKQENSDEVNCTSDVLLMSTKRFELLHCPYIIKLRKQGEGSSLKIQEDRLISTVFLFTSISK